jgi:hypothetical protein
MYLKTISQVPAFPFYNILPFFAAQKHGRGALQRVVFTGLINLKTKSLSFGTLYLFSKNVLAYLDKPGDKPRQLVELEPSDSINTLSPDDPLIQEFINQNPDVSRIAFNLDTTHPLAYVCINNHLLLLPDIQPFRVYGKPRLKPITKYLNSANYEQEVKNLTQAINQIVQNQPPDLTPPLSGISPSVARLNIYTQCVIALVASVGFVLVLVSNPELILPALLFLAFGYILTHAF